MSSGVLVILRALYGLDQLPTGWGSKRKSNAISQLCNHHGLAGYVLHQLKEVDPEQSFFDRTRLIKEEKERRKTLLTDLRDFEAVKAVLTASNIPVGTLKGPFLSESLFDDLGMRVSKDLDAYVGQTDFREALKLLAANGFTVSEPLLNASGEAIERFQKVRKDTTILMPNGGELELHFRPLMSPRMSDQIEWRIENKLLKMTKASEAFYILCHGQAASWFRLKWALDAVTFLDGLGAKDWQALYEKCERTSTLKSLSNGLEYLDYLFETEHQEQFPIFPASGHRMGAMIQGLDNPNQRMRHRDYICLSDDWSQRWLTFQAHYLDPGPSLLGEHSKLHRMFAGGWHILQSSISRMSKLWRSEP